MGYAQNKLVRPWQSPLKGSFSSRLRSRPAAGATLGFCQSLTLSSALTSTAYCRVLALCKRDLTGFSSLMRPRPSCEWKPRLVTQPKSGCRSRQPSVHAAADCGESLVCFLPQMVDMPVTAVCLSWLPVISYSSFHHLAPPTLTVYCMSDVGVTDNVWGLRFVAEFALKTSLSWSKKRKAARLDFSWCIFVSVNMFVETELCFL